MKILKHALTKETKNKLHQTKLINQLIKKNPLRIETKVSCADYHYTQKMHAKHRQLCRSRAKHHRKSD